MEEQRISNYERLCEQWRQKFLGMDQERLCAKLPELVRAGEYLTIRHFGRTFGVHAKTGYISDLDTGAPVPVNTRMDLYNLFWYAKEHAGRTGCWVPFRDVRDASPFTSAFEKHILAPFARTFSGHAQLLERAALSLGAQLLPRGDVGFQIDCFACIPMQFYFWDADDEFPAQANILFDSGVTDWIHVESTVTLASEGMNRLAEAAGLQLDDQGYGL